MNIEAVLNDLDTVFTARDKGSVFETYLRIKRAIKDMETAGAEAEFKPHVVCSAEVAKAFSIPPEVCKVRKTKAPEKPRPNDCRIDSHAFESMPHRFAVESDHMTAFMRLVTAIVKGTSDYCIESNVLVEKNGTELTLRCTDNSRWLERRYLTHLESADFRIAIHAKTLADAVKKAPKNEWVYFGIDAENKVRVRIGDAETTITGLVPEDFPWPEAKAGEDVLACPLYHFIDDIEKVLPFTAKDKFKPVLRGVYFERKGEYVYLVATDGKRLAHQNFTTDCGPDNEVGIIIDPIALDVLAKMVKGGVDGDMVMTVMDQTVRFTIGSYTLEAQLIEGVYPNWRQVIPTGFSGTFSVDRKEMLTALHHVEPMAKTLNNNKTWLHPRADGVIDIRCVNKNNEVHKSVAGTRVDGAAESLAFNCKYLIDILDSIEDDKVVLEFNYNQAPARIRGTGRGDHFTIVMPMKGVEDYE